MAEQRIPDPSQEEKLILVSPVERKYKISSESRAKMSAARKGKKKSLETRAKMSAAWRGRPRPWVSEWNHIHKKGQTLSVETRKKMSLAHMGQPPTLGMTGRKLTPEQRAKVSAAKKGIPRPDVAIRNHLEKKGTHWNDQSRMKFSLIMKRRKWTSEQREKQIAVRKGKMFTEQHRANLSAALKQKPFRPLSLEHRAKIAKANSGHPVSQETRAKVGLAHTGKSWDFLTPEIVARRAKAIAQSLRKHPNKLEKACLAILIKYFPETGWRFNDGLIVAGKIPDFIPSDGSRIVVDAFGDYWHRKDTEESIRERQSLFLKESYTLIVIWERDFKTDPYFLVQQVKVAQSLVRLAA